MAHGGDAAREAGDGDHDGVVAVTRRSCHAEASEGVATIPHPTIGSRRRTRAGCTLDGTRCGAYRSTPAAARDRRRNTAWCDYNGHMSESSYLLVVGDNADAFFRYFGIDEEYRANGGSLYTAETHLHHLTRVRRGRPPRLHAAGARRRPKARPHRARGARGRSGQPVATAEQMLLHVDMAAGKVATPARPPVRAAQGDRGRACRPAGPRLRRPRHGAATRQTHGVKEVPHGLRPERRAACRSSTPSAPSSSGSWSRTRTRSSSSTR